MPPERIIFVGLQGEGKSICYGEHSRGNPRAWEQGLMNEDFDQVRVVVPLPGIA